MSLIYLDHHATTPVDPRVVEAMAPYWTEFAANPASIGHQSGDRARIAVRHAREQIAACLGCNADEIVFTSGATESNNLALKGVMGASGNRAALVVNAAEHRSILDPARRLKRQGTPLTMLPIDSAGRAIPMMLPTVLTTDTALVSVMWANNEVGSLNDIAAMAEICQQHRVRVHVDASQAVGKVAVNLSAVPVDLLSCTAHKLHGPMGIGCLFVRKNSSHRPLQPLFDGGGQEGGLRSGTLPLPLIVGFAKAIELATQQFDVETARLAYLRDSLWLQLQARIPGIIRNTPLDNCLPNNLNVQLPNVHGDVLLVRLKSTPLCISSGSACTSSNPEPSHVLRAMGLTDSQTRASVRFGLGRFNTELEIATAAALLSQVVCELQDHR